MSDLLRDAVDIRDPRLPAGRIFFEGMGDEKKCSDEEMKGTKNSERDEVEAWGDLWPRGQETWNRMLPGWRDLTGLLPELERIVALYAAHRSKPPPSIIQFDKSDGFLFVFVCLFLGGCMTELAKVGRKVGKRVWAVCLVGHQVYMGTANGLRVYNLLKGSCSILSNSGVDRICRHKRAIIVASRDRNRRVITTFCTETNTATNRIVFPRPCAINTILAMICDGRSRLIALASQGDERTANFHSYDLNDSKQVTHKVAYDYAGISTQQQQFDGFSWVNQDHMMTTDGQSVFYLGGRAGWETWTLHSIVEEGEILHIKYLQTFEKNLIAAHALGQGVLLLATTDDIFLLQGPQFQRKTTLQATKEPISHFAIDPDNPELAVAINHNGQYPRVFTVT